MQLAGCEAVLDAAGALWLPGARTLVVSDLHLEKASSLARRGMLLPPYDTGATLRRLESAVRARDPRSVICLGDSFHDRAGPERLAGEARARIAALQRGRDWVWVTGNHDPELPPAIGGETAATLVLGALTFRHEPCGGIRGEVAGHLHPAAKVARHGRSVRRRAFVSDGERLVLPAFGVLAGGLNVLDRAFAQVFRADAFLAFMLGERRLYPVAPHALAGD
ncbi:ligase-associated DNA damage response endonuclease PdeM [Rhizobiales bacterium L72]|uniref:Ligase-associated DNA damage response endonuclease PdeM n=1 Tax=Propylenella binzhouense TaxID=2555902 RepID=A0A964WVJ5_9HYPH|nr:ligase-associated DNA damage response endonuclease PdeM [Propylenella binzhouense]